MIETKQHCGYISIIGRPNVGKSTLLNRLLGEKISITSRKPQTTRHSILGVKTLGMTQLLFVDTPGLQIKTQKALNKLLNQSAQSALHDMNMILFVIQALQWTQADAWILKQLQAIGTPILLIINQIDKVKQKAELLPFIDHMRWQASFHALLPLSAKTGQGVPELLTQLVSHMPVAPHLYGQDDITDKSVRFLIAEIIREKLMRLTGQELPYAVAVEIESYQEKPKITVIHAIIWVERASQKPMIIGKQGQRLKEVGQLARANIETLIDKKVLLKLWVKIKTNWSDDEKALRNLGYL